MLHSFNKKVGKVFTLGIVHHHPGQLKISGTHGMLMPARDDGAVMRLIDESRSGERRAMYATMLRCVFCGTEYPLTHRGSCARCAGPGEESALYETLAVQYDVAALKRRLDREELARRPAGLWRYRERLPVVDPAFRVEPGAGGTRLVPLARIAEAVGCLGLLRKVEGAHPTGSFKDRPIGVAAGVDLERGARGLACLTSGNIGSAMAAVPAHVCRPAARSGLAGRRLVRFPGHPFCRGTH